MHKFYAGPLLSTALLSALLSACVSHAVRCDRRLQPINSAVAGASPAAAAPQSPPRLL